jgi:hypothetical protein
MSDRSRCAVQKIVTVAQESNGRISAVELKHLLNVYNICT